MSQSEVKKCNKSEYAVGLAREDFFYISKLEDLYIRKITKDQRDNKKQKEALVRLIKEKKTVVLNDSVLGKRGLVLDRKSFQTDRTTNNFMFNGPEIKLRYKIEFAKDYMDRVPIDDQDIEPDIQRFNLNDVEDEITVVETNVMVRVLIVGTSSGKIEAFFFIKEATESEAFKEKNAEEKEKEKNKEFLEKVLEAKQDKYSLELKKIEFFGHTNAVTSLSISYDSSYFISGSVDTAIRLWNLKIGHCLAVFKGHLRTVWTVKISPKGFYFLSGGADSLIFLWSTNKAKPIMSFTEHTEDVTSVDFTYNLNYVCSASLDKTFRVWSLENGSLVRVLFFQEPLTCFRVNKAGDLLVGGTKHGLVYVWNLSKPVLLYSFNFNKDAKNRRSTMASKIRNIAFTVDERYVIISSKEKLAYYGAIYLMEEKSKDMFKTFNFDCYHGTKKERNLGPEPINYFKTKSSNLLFMTPTSKNGIIVVNKVKDKCWKKND